ncbi:MAG: HEPN domain-containing protein [Candidatus Aenigmarchaeota archaeon]|nr:HEPN domain-containing protein [Candidatus Aenigmarchaeota archaeon]
MTELRREIKNWWEQGKNDLKKAKVLFNTQNFDGTAFYCQQAVEKSLKALILFKSKEKKIEGHSLVYLGKQAKMPDNFFPSLRKLSPQYFISRYPDVTEEIPYELYDDIVAKEFLDTAEKVILRIKKQLE